MTNLKYYKYQASAEYGRRGGFHRRENVEKQCKTVQNSILAPKRAVTAQNSNFWIQNLNFKLPFALLTSNITYMKRLRSMGAGEASTDEKTSKNSAKQCKTVILAPKRPLQLSKFKILNSKLEFQASSCNTNPKCYICEASAEYGRQGDLHRRENVEKQCKTVILAPKRPLQLSKFKVFNSKLEFQASLCITDLKY